MLRIFFGLMLGFSTFVSSVAHAADNTLSVFFGPGSTSLSPDALAVLDTAARTYREGSPIVMVVSGGTDATGPAGFNLRLSQMRAQAVLNGLVERGIPIERFQVLAKGATEPAVNSPAGVPEAKNRKVDISWR